MRAVVSHKGADFVHLGVIKIVLFLSAIFSAPNKVFADEGKATIVVPSSLTSKQLVSLSSQYNNIADADFETVVRTTAATDPSPREDDSASASVINETRTPRSGESLPQLLTELPGATVSQLGGLGSLATLSLRGSSANQVLVYLDGVPLNSAVGGGVDLSTIPIGDIERIEVYRGMSPLAFGSSAIGGVVAINTRSPRETGAWVSLGAGSFGQELAEARGTLVFKNLKLYAGAQALNANGNFIYNSDNGTRYTANDDQKLRRQNNELQQASGLLRGAFDFGDSRKLIINLSAFTREQGLPGYGIYPLTQAAFDTRRFLASLVFKSRPDFVNNEPMQILAYAGTTEKRRYDPRLEILPLPGDTRDTTNTTGATWHLTIPLTTIVKLSSVVDTRYEQYLPRDLTNTIASQVANVKASHVFTAAGLQTELIVAPINLKITPSARFEFSRETIAGRDAFFTLQKANHSIEHKLPIVRLALLQKPFTDLNLRANVGRYARLPSLIELYGDNSFILSNLKLDPEWGYNFDAGANYEVNTNSNKVIFDIAAFGSYVHQLIQYKQNTQGQVRAYNAGQVRIYGLESSMQIRLYKYLQLISQVTYTDSRDISDIKAHYNKQLPLRPKLRSYSRFEVREFNITSQLNIGAYVDTDYTSDNYADPTNMVQINQRLLFSAGVYLNSVNSHIRIMASVKNISNTQVSDLIGYPLPGRSFYINLDVTTSNLSQGM